MHRVVRLCSINDVYELTNLPRLRTFIKSLEPAPAAVVLSGDFVSPSTLSSVDGGRGMIATLRAAGITHASFGNHEADVKLRWVVNRERKVCKNQVYIWLGLNARCSPTAYSGKG